MGGFFQWEGFLTFLEGSRGFDVILNNRIIGTIGVNWENNGRDFSMGGFFQWEGF